MFDKVALESCTTAADFETGFEDALPLKMEILMMWISDADDIAIY